MAATTATTTHAYRRQDLQPAMTPKNWTYNSCVNLTTKTRRRFCIRSSLEDETTTTTTTTTSTEEAEDGSEEIEAQKGPLSLISALNVEKALRGISITDVDYYGTLGLQRGCSIDQVTMAYREKLEEVMKEGLEEEELSKRVELLKESHSILSTMEDRRLYDWSLARNENPDAYVWPFEVDSPSTSPDTPPAEEEEDVGPTRLVGYFILGWMLLSFALSIALNR